MSLNLMRGLTALAIATLPLAGVAATFTIAGAEAAYAERGGNGNGNGGGNGGGRSSERSNEERGNGRGNGGLRGGAGGEDNPGRGAIASELKGLNACNASATARLNASADSQVGRIAAYETAVQQSATASADYQAAVNAYEAFEGSYTGRSSTAIQAEIDALGTAITAEQQTALNAELLAAQAYETQLATLQATVDAKLTASETAAEQERTALDAASGGRVLSEDAVAALQDCLET